MSLGLRQGGSQPVEVSILAFVPPASPPLTPIVHPVAKESSRDSILLWHRVVPSPHWFPSFSWSDSCTWCRPGPPSPLGHGCLHGPAPGSLATCLCLAAVLSLTSEYRLFPPARRPSRTSLLSNLFLAFLDQTSPLSGHPALTSLRAHPLSHSLNTWPLIHSFNKNVRRPTRYQVLWRVLVLQ